MDCLEGVSQVESVGLLGVVSCEQSFEDWHAELKRIASSNKNHVTLNAYSSKTTWSLRKVEIVRGQFFTEVSSS